MDLKLIRKIVTISFLAIVGCSTVEKERSIVSASGSEEFGSYVRLFTNESESRGLSIDTTGLRIYMVEFGEALRNQGVIGLCSPEGDKQIIYVSQADWNSYDSLQREMLIFHEMGHCLLQEEHDQSTDAEGVPMDLMFPSNFPSSYYHLARQAYLNRMFGKVINRIKAEQAAIEAGEKVSGPPARRIYKCQWKKQYKVKIRNKNGKPTRR